MIGDKHRGEHIGSLMRIRFIQFRFFKANTIKEKHLLKK